MKDYWKHDNNFIRHYIFKYQVPRLKQNANEIAKNKDYHNLIRGQNTEEHNKNFDRTSLVINCHKHFARISKIRQDSYGHIAKRYPKQPIVSFKRNKEIREI